MKSNTMGRGRVPQPEDKEFGWGKMLKAFFFLLEEKRKRYVFWTIVIIIVLFYDLVPAFLVGKIVDFFTSYKPGDSLKVFYVYVATLSITWGVVSQIRLAAKRNLANIQSEVTYTTRVKGFQRLIDFSLKWHDSENTGNKIQKIQAGSDTLKSLQGILSGTGNGLYGQIVTVVGVLSSFFFFGTNFFIFGILYIALFLGVQIYFYKRQIELAIEANKALEKASGTYYEGLSNVLTIKTLGVKNDFKQGITVQEESSRDFSIRRINLSNLKWQSFQIVNALAVGTNLLIAGHNFVIGTMSLGSFFIVYTYFQKLNGSMGEATGVVDDLMNAKVSVARMMPIFWSNELSNRGNEKFPSDWESIKISDASFSYKEDSNKEAEGSLHNINLSIHKHEKIGVVGRSGSGKSTFAKILIGLYDFQKGTYSVGRRDFNTIDHDDVTKHMALVLQDSEMFNLSLKENITLMRTFDQDLFNKAVHVAALSDLISKLPEGEDTLIGEKGYRLSGGERQRIGIARAIYKDPEILIFDESTSSLDSKTETAILKSFEEQLGDKTVISIAHRISTLKNTDRIIVFEQGKIVEEGSFKELSKDKESKFFELYHTQSTTGQV